MQHSGDTYDVNAKNNDYQAFVRESSNLGFELTLNLRIKQKSMQMSENQIDRMKLHALS